jgi:hypothetical protein
MFSEATVTGRGTNLHVSHGTDDNLLVRFYFNKIHDRDFVKINIPGDNKTEWDQPVREIDKRRFSRQYEAYKAQQNQFSGQITLEDSGIYEENKINTYKAFNILTVDQLAKLNDAFISKIGMGARDDVRKANAFLAEQQDKGKQIALERELQLRDEKNAQLQQQMLEMQQQLAELKPRAKPGPKPKEQQNDLS